MSRPFLVTALAAAALAVFAGSANARPGLVLGADDDTLRWTEDAPGAVGHERDLGLGAIRMTLHWGAGQSKLDDDGRTCLRRAQNAARLGLRVVLAVYGDAESPPVSADAQAQYCSYVQDA